ncbi:ATP-binding protein [Streptomyces griseochromogenes]|uniref:ATP-binding protein n=1 Tax=Streptomyces griseochromogenes TaxID=68214 RepID=UPI0037B25CBE
MGVGDALRTWGFDGSGEVPGLKPLPEGLSPELREFVVALRSLFRATGKSLRQFSVYHHVSAPSVSRYLSGVRIPEKAFLDALLKSACRACGPEATLEVQAHIYRLHRDVLLAQDPQRYRAQLASDRLEVAVLEKEQAELTITELRRGVSDQKRQLRELELHLRQVQDARSRDSVRHGVQLSLQHEREEAWRAQCGQLKSEIARLEAAVRRAEAERDAAWELCRQLEEELARIEADVERAAQERAEEEEHLRRAAAQGAPENFQEELARAYRAAEALRLTAAQDAAALEHLREVAQDVARRRLPEIVAQLSSPDPLDVDTSVASLGVHDRTEINQVARAFDEVQQEAVRLAAEQALLRGNINAMFTGLSRRTLGLVQRQLSLLTHLQSRVSDPDQLAHLFRLDNLTTKMRRNGENLLVLGGEEPGQRWSHPAALVDVLRASAAEVEQYERIQLGQLPAADVASPVINDLVHLLAELLENATSFSSPQTLVRVAAHALPDGRVLVEIHDTGIGLSPEDLAGINQRLASPPVVDVAVSRRMGLYVVGRLSQRHDIRIQLRPSDTGGTTALVMLPQRSLAQAA